VFEIILFFIFILFFLFAPFLLLPRIARINRVFWFISVITAIFLLGTHLSVVNSPLVNLYIPSWIVPKFVRWIVNNLGLLYELFSMMFLEFMGKYPIFFYFLPTEPLAKLQLDGQVDEYQALDSPFF
jgi:hypothetical protein